MLRTANWILMTSVRLGPWIHVGSTVRNLGLITDGAHVATRGSVRAEYEKKGHRFVDLDLVVTADERPVALIDHTAIYRPRQVAEADDDRPAPHPRVVRLHGTGRRAGGEVGARRRGGIRHGRLAPRVGGRHLARGTGRPSDPPASIPCGR
ncbi:MAG: hypothetical protein R2755_11845 [Acidimicrobiales bacterium]